MQFNTFFDETSSGKHVPRCLYLDLEPTVLDDIRVGPYCELYRPESFLSGAHDAANNFARGYCSMGSQIIVRAARSHVVARCDVFSERGRA
jgi:tubulin alpha